MVETVIQFLTPCTLNIAVRKILAPDNMFCTHIFQNLLLLVLEENQVSLCLDFIEDNFRPIYKGLILSSIQFSTVICVVVQSVLRSRFVPMHIYSCAIFFSLQLASQPLTSQYMSLLLFNPLTSGDWYGNEFDSGCSWRTNCGCSHPLGSLSPPSPAREWNAYEGIWSETAERSQSSTWVQHNS